MSKFQRGGQGFQGSRNGDYNSRNFNNAPHINRNAPNRLNPWETGVAPGAGNNMFNMGMGNLSGQGRRHCGGLLPTPHISGPGLLPQPLVRDVQLAVASKMLDIYLPGQQNQQQNQPPNQMPPVLGLNTSNNRPGLLGPPVFQNPNFGGPGSRTRTQGMVKGQQGPKDNGRRPFLAGRRPDPYIKAGNRSQRIGQRNDNRTGPNNSSLGASLTTKNVTQQTRIVKNEKQDGNSNLKTDIISNDKELKPKQEFEKTSESEKSIDSFRDVPSELLYCNICSKKMWDSSSFINHIKGKLHQAQMALRENSYKEQVEMMRRQTKLQEQQSHSLGPREFCTMCNLSFRGSLNAHRGCEGHKQLKSFLHPRCDICNKEFGTRTDWDHHLLTPEHLLAFATKNQSKIQEGNSQKRPKQVKEDNPNKRSKQSPDKIASDASSTRTENNCSESLVVNKSGESLPVNICSESLPVNECGGQSGMGNSSTSLVSSLSPLKTVNNIEEKRENPIPLNPSSIDQNQIPAFDSQKEIGMDMLQEKTGYLCRCCNRFLSCSADAKTHCRSQYHYEKYVSYMNSKHMKSLKCSGNEVASPLTQGKSGNSQVDKEVNQEENQGRPKKGNSQDEPEEDKQVDLQDEKSKDDVEPDDVEQGDVEHDDDDEDEEDESNWKRKKTVMEEEEDNDHLNTEEQEHPVSKKQNAECISTSVDVIDTLKDATASEMTL